jgi:hypothetical protein
MAAPETKADTSTPEEPKKSKLEKILTSAPVILTVIATLLAGMSSSEMTQAQYHRSLAAQYQSKVSDQWNFFQAKRIRETTLSSTNLQMRAGLNFVRPTAEILNNAAKNLTADLERIEKEARQIKVPMLDTGKFLAMLGKLRKDADAAIQKAIKDGVLPDKDADAAKVKLAPIFEFLSTRKLPKVEDEDLVGRIREKNKEMAERFLELEKEITNRKTEPETLGLVSKITEAAMKEAGEVAETNARRFEDACDEFKNGFRAIDELVNKQMDIVVELYPAVVRLNRMAPAGAAENGAETRMSLDNLTRIADTLKEETERLGTGFKTGFNDYTARRYNKDAQYNMVSARVVEMEVRKSSHESDRHRTRSKFFFYAMLTAQAGVTVASFAIAYKRRSLMFGLASVAGALAISFGSYVFLTM